MSNDDQNWLDLLAGQSAPDAEPNTVRDAKIFRGALLAHADKNDAEIPYPHILNNVLSHIESKGIMNPPKPPSWISTLSQTLKDVFTSLILPPKIVWAIPATACVLVSVITCFIICPQIPDPIDTTYQTIYANKTDEMADDLRDFKFRWEGESDNVFAFSSSDQPSEAAKAFGAGLLTGREALLGKSEIALPPLFLPPTEETWLKTQWVNDFKLGRWVMLLWIASQFHHDLQPPFWDEQREIFFQLKVAFMARAKTDHEAKKVLSQLKNKIEPHLEKLPTQNNPKLYKVLSFNLKKMIYFLAPKPEYKL